VFDGGIRIAFPKYVAGEKKKNVKNRGLAVVIPVLILAGVGIWYWANRGAEAANEAPRVRSTLHLETFVLNLADTDQRSYLRVGIDLGLTQEAKHGEELAPMAEVRDTILTVLAEAKLNDLMTAVGKTKLKQDLLHALQERVPRLGVDEVYFTEFLIQR
jgi:flagellar basal body-associated protein FliL